MDEHNGLDYILSLHGTRVNREDGYWWKRFFYPDRRSHTQERKPRLMMKARIGVMPEELIRKRILAIAKGEYQPQEREPKVWFTSMIALAQVLSNENIALLRLIDTARPETISQLAELSGRQVSNLSTTLKTLSGHGLVALEKQGRSVKPRALFTDFEIIVDQKLNARFSAA